MTTTAAAGPAARTKVALTFDDLPVHGPLPPGTTRADVARSIVATLKAAKAPATYGFINAKGIQDAPETAEFLEIWRAAGHPLGNHTFSHMDLHTNSVEAFEKDALANEPTLQASMGANDWHWFRYPYLREGETIEKRHAIAAFLGERGYRVAEVTLSFDDYAYNDPYATLPRRQGQRRPRVAEGELRESRGGRALTRGREEARRLYGRDIGHVMLLHVGAFQMVMLPRLMDLLGEQWVRSRHASGSTGRPGVHGVRVGRADEGRLDAPGPDARGPRPDSPARRRQVHEAKRAL